MTTVMDQRTLTDSASDSFLTDRSVQFCQICFLRSDHENVLLNSRLRPSGQTDPLHRPIRLSPKIKPSDCPPRIIPSDHEFKKIVINQVLAAALPYAVYHAHCPQ